MTGWPGVSEPLEGAKLRVLSLGAGVQSTTLALMAKHGDIEMPDCAIFADTGWEPHEVYTHLDWLASVLPFPVHRTRRAGLDLGELTLAVARGERSQAGNQLVPFYTDGGLSPKQCSKEFKTRPVARAIRAMLPEPPKRGCGHIVELLMGMSTDELQRLKVNERPWIRNRYPLVEKHMSRADCKHWLSERQYSAPRSACIFCGYRSKREWARVLADPEDGPRVLAFDAAIRPLMPSGAFLTPAHKPLAEIDFSEPETGQGDLFANECEGMCAA